jgi:hypothetical protein
MKKIIYLLALFPLISFAQTNMPEGMQDLMQQAQKAQACMENIDESQFDTLEQEGKNMQSEIKSLCSAGKRDEAQKQAISYSKEMMARPEMQQIQKCSEMLRGMIPDMPFDNFEEKYKNQHICDDI